jgi:hypothetical protein
MSLLKSQTIWTGNTFAHKDYIKSLGGRWDADRKAWIVPAMTMRERSNVRVPKGVDVSKA